jgi:hypothetical protein
MVKVPFAALFRVAVAMPLPLVVVTPDSVPPVVVKTTEVPVATGVPLDFRTVALTVTGVLMRVEAGVADTVKDAGAFGSDDEPPPPPHPSTVMTIRDKKRLNSFLTFMATSLSIPTGLNID